MAHPPQALRVDELGTGCNAFVGSLRIEYFDLMPRLTALDLNETPVPMNFCPNCAAALTLQIPEGDTLPRHVCSNCGAIHYQNPKIVAGCIPLWQDRILLCKRAIEPRYGLWTLPAGFMENGETVAQAAVRETSEEARASVIDLELYGLFNIPHVNQVYIMFKAELESPTFSAGTESLEVKLVTEAEIPWEELAFPVMQRTLQLFIEDRRRGSFGNHMFDIEALKRRR